MAFFTLTVRPADVFAIEPDPDKGFWIATEWSGVFRINGKKLQQVPSIPQKLYVRKIHRAADGTLWFGTNEGLYKNEGGRLAKVLDRNWVLALGSDDQGNLWFGHGWNGGGANRYHPKTGAISVIAKAQGLRTIRSGPLSGAPMGGSGWGPAQDWHDTEKARSRISAKNSECSRARC